MEENEARVEDVSPLKDKIQIRVTLCTKCNSKVPLIQV